MPKDMQLPGAVPQMNLAQLIRYGFFNGGGAPLFQEEQQPSQAVTPDSLRLTIVSVLDMLSDDDDEQEILFDDSGRAEPPTKGNSSGHGRRQ